VLRQLTNKFLHRVRIHGGEFDSSARAMNRAEESNLLQADQRKFRGSTIERKQMSTTIKRIALVAVAALGLSVVAVAPSSAIPQADSLSLSAATASTTVGTAVTVDATVEFLQETAADSMTLTLSYAQAPSGIAVNEADFSSITAVTSDVNAPTVDTATARVAIVGKAPAASLKKTLTIKLTPSKAGTYVIRVTPTYTGSTVVPAATVKTWTVTVAAKTIGLKSAFIGTAVGANDTATADATAANLTVTAAASTTAKARIDVGQVYGTTGNDTATAADAQSVVVTTDRGLVSKTNDYSAAAKSVTTLAGVDADSSYWVFSNGDIGAAAITITVGGTLLATKTVTFTGAATSLVATLTTGQDAFVKVGGTSTTTITAKDSAGSTLTTIPTGLTVKSSDTSVATVAISSGVVTVTGVKAGTSTITVTDPATSAAATPVTFVATVAPVRPTAAPTVTFDKSSYETGELVTMTVSANMGDSATAQLFTSSSLVLSATVVASGTAVPTNGQFAIVGGKATYKFYAPAVSGTLIATGTTGGAVDITTAATVTASVSITNAAADAALDAANEAATAAQDATDAAIQAADAADEATAAVAALQLEVNTLIAGLKKQLTTLTNLVKNLAKAVAKK